MNGNLANVMSPVQPQTTFAERKTANWNIRGAWKDSFWLDFEDGWVHLRKSNTEPIIRVYSEAATMEAADELGKALMKVVYDMQ